VIRAVWLDVGETLVDETPAWEAVADALRIPRFTLMGVLGGLAERREPHGRVFDLLGVAWPPPGADEPPPGRLYPDAAGCLSALREAGYATGVCGNQPQRTEAWLAAAGVAADEVASSASLGAAKPDPAFFAALADRSGVAPAAVAYVGDRVDLDVLPAVAAGMTAVLVRRGPWGILHAGHPDAAAAAAVIDSLDELVPLLAALNSPS
jgi:FMN phosphatase YigB (HAD superfamily)